jgi:hypothetical protein
MKWLYAPVPRGRIAVFRTLVYAFAALDPIVFTPWVRGHANADPGLYHPLLVSRLLHLPTPTALIINAIFVMLIVAAVFAALGRAPRALGWTVFGLYFAWMLVAMSYGKVDHDRFAFLVALAVLPTCGRASWRDKEESERAGWALRVVQLAVVATYFLASWAKLRYGGPEWMTGSVLARAILRRGTDLADLIAPIPYLLIAAQIGIMAFELSSPLVFVVPEKWRVRVVGFFYSFHLVTFAMITISFAPHLVAMSSFLPLERWWERAVHRIRRNRRPAVAEEPPALEPLASG